MPNIRPSQKINYPEQDLRLGIKSSIHKPKETLGLFLLLWELNNNKASCDYSRSENNKIILSEEFENEISNLDISLETVNKHPLFTVQLESLQVFFELIYRLGEIKFVNANLSNSTERTGGIRYQKAIYFSKNMDIIELLSMDCKELYKKVLLKWIKSELIDNDDLLAIEQKLIKLLTVFTEETVYKVRTDDHVELEFRNENIYDVLLQSPENTVDINDSIEQVGPTRILSNIINEGLHAYLKKDTNTKTLKLQQEKQQELTEYYQRVNKSLQLSTVKLIIEIQDKDEVEISTTISKPHNRIVFGAPGTGKSYLLEKERKEYFIDEKMERVTFHSSYTYANFVGTYKPTMINSNNTISPEEKEVISILTDNSKTAQEKYDSLHKSFLQNGKGTTTLDVLTNVCLDDFKIRLNSGEFGDNTSQKNHGKNLRPYLTLKSISNASSEIAYKYVPGPFVRILVKALKNPNENYLLLIEEINRANPAATFGDIFQLLDRENGASKYDIDMSEDLKQYLISEELTVDKLKLPSNLYIWATMNSADQGVFPMDTAFKRRWSFEYLGVDSNEGEIEGISVNINNTDILWNKFRKKINEKLSQECQVHEDKLLGPFFVSKREIEENFTRVFKEKILMYLYEDAAKHSRKKLFKDDTQIYTYSQLCKEFDNRGIEIFGFSADELKIQTEILETQDTDETSTPEETKNN